MDPSGDTTVLEEALRNCASEPIHIPGRIQPHGILLAIDPDTFEVTMASENAAESLMVQTEQILGAELGRVVGISVRDRVAQFRSSNKLPSPSRFLASIEREGSTWIAEASVHQRGSRIILEIEHSDLGGIASTLQLADWIHQFPRNNQDASTIVPFCQSIVEVVRQFSGYDRTMIYRFYPDLHGEVIAESARPGLTSYLGLHYPASDIPSQARALYLLSRVRVLVDVHAPTVAIKAQPELDSEPPLDMALCQLRSFSPVHLEYLNNMGVRASLVTSIIQEDRLWGLVVCHHGSPRKPSHALRAACNLLSEMISVEVATQEKRENLQARRAVADIQRRIIETYNDDSDWKLAILSSSEPLLQPIPCDGMAIVEETTAFVLGKAPEVAEILKIRDWILDNGPAPIYSTDDLSAAAPECAGIESACGILSVEINRASPTHLIWFRGEFVRQVEWAGEPKHFVMNDGGKAILHPRTSFAAWKSEVVGRCRSWEGIELATANELRTVSMDAVLRTSILKGTVARIELVRVQKAVEASSEAILIADQTGQPTFVNRAFVELCGLEIGELPKRSLSAPISDPLLRNEILEATLGNSGSWHGEVEVPVKGDGTTPVTLGIDPVFNDSGEVLGFIAIHFDLTERDRARRILEENGRRLELARAEIEQQAHLIREAWTRAESANRAKSDFLANMCHEIRTPMNGVIGLCELLLDTDLNPAQRKYAATIRTSGDALMTIINDILDLSKIEAGKMTIVHTELDLESLLVELRDLLAPKAKQNDIQLIVRLDDDIPADLVGDPIRIRQILTNLVGNAIKFTHHGEVQIHVKLDGSSLTEARIRIEVKDTGIGISSLMQESIFDSFTQAETGTMRAAAGTGLGLSICRRLAELMGGEVNCTSEQGKGSTFWLSLTLERQDRASFEPTTTAIPGLPVLTPGDRKLRILIAEDNAINQIVARGLITRLGHEVVLVENGRDAVEVYSREKFDLVLMDIQMPIMDGYTATKEIRSLEVLGGHRTTIMALTAYSLQEERQNCLDADMDGCLTKPITFKALGEMLERFVAGTISLS